MLKEVFKLTGPIIDAGDLPEGRGFAIAHKGESVCVTGLSIEQTKEAGKLMGKFVAVQVHALVDGDPQP